MKTNESDGRCAIETQMNKLRLHNMVKSYTTLQEIRKLHELSLHEDLELLLQAEAQERDNRRFKRLEYNASFRYNSSSAPVLMKIRNKSQDRTRGIS